MGRSWDSFLLLLLLLFLLLPSFLPSFFFFLLTLFLAFDLSLYLSFAHTCGTYIFFPVVSFSQYIFSNSCALNLGFFLSPSACRLSGALRVGEIKGRLALRRWLFAKMQEVYLDDSVADTLLGHEVIEGIVAIRRSRLRVVDLQCEGALLSMTCDLSFLLR